MRIWFFHSAFILKIQTLFWSLPVVWLISISLCRCVYLNLEVAMATCLSLPLSHSLLQWISHCYTMVTIICKHLHSCYTCHLQQEKLVKICKHHLLMFMRNFILDLISAGNWRNLSLSLVRYYFSDNSIPNVFCVSMRNFPKTCKATKHCHFERHHLCYEFNGIAKEIQCLIRKMTKAHECIWWTWKIMDQQSSRQSTRLKSNSLFKAPGSKRHPDLPAPCKNE